MIEQTWPLLAAWEDCHGRTHAEVAVRLAALAGDDVDATSSVGRRDQALLDVRSRLLGPNFELRIDCPSCSVRLELEITVDEVRRRSGDASATHVIDVDSCRATFRLPDSIDLAEAVEAPTRSQRWTQLWQACVQVERHGQVLDVADVPPTVIEAVESEMRRLDEQAVASESLTCPDCGQTWDAVFDIVPVIWAEFDGLVRRQLADVHQLASAYGWSESELLALGPARRAFYLDRV